MQAAGLRLFLYRWQMRAFVFLFPRFCGKAKNPIPGTARSRTVCLRACPDWAGRIPRFFFGSGRKFGYNGVYHKNRYASIAFSKNFEASGWLSTSFLMIRDGFLNFFRKIFADYVQYATLFVYIM